MNRAERRRHERRPDRVIIAGDGLIAYPTGEMFRSENAAGRMPAKRDGVHRWVVIASYVATAEQARTAFDVDALKIMDHENLLSLSLGCIDCEQALGQVDADSRCPAGDEWTVAS